MNKEKEKCIVYIGDFDFRNENVQSHLVKNNGLILNSLGFRVIYIGINIFSKKLNGIEKLPKISLNNKDVYYELPNTLNFLGFFKYFYIQKKVMGILKHIYHDKDLNYIITYQSPTYAFILKKIALWAKGKNIKYIVNSADLPTFKMQKFPRNIIMKLNWHLLHYFNKKYSDGVIAVSKFLKNFYYKNSCVFLILPPLFNTSSEIQANFKVDNFTSFIYAGMPFKITGGKVRVDGMKDRLDKIVDLFLLLSEKGIVYQFKILGITKNQYIKSVPRHSSLLTLNSNIKFFGNLTHTETLAMVTISDFSINYRDDNLMTKAGFSTKLVESISLGTPIITNPVSDIFDYLEEGVSAFKLSDNLDYNLHKLESLCNLSINERVILKQRTYNSKVFNPSNYIDSMKDFMIRLKNK